MEVEELLPTASITKAGFIKKGMYHEIPTPIKKYVYFKLGSGGTYTGIISFNRHEYRCMTLINADVYSTGSDIANFKIKNFYSGVVSIMTSAKYYTKNNTNYLQFEIIEGQGVFTSVTMLYVGGGRVLDVFTDDSDLSEGATRTISGKIEIL